MPKLKILILTVFSLLFLATFSHTSAANVSFNITANSGSASPGQGSFSPNSINVDQGDNVTITFSVPAGDPYCCGLQVKGNGGQFDTGTINKGSSKQVTFTASSTFNFTSYWPGTGTVKATGSVNVTQNTPSPTPPPAPTNISGSGISTSQIELSWAASSGANKYQVFRDGTLKVNTTTLNYSDSNLNPNTTYKYKVKACLNTACSGFSNEISVKTQAFQDDPVSGDGEGTITPTPTTNTNPTQIPDMPEEGNGNPDGLFVDPKYDYVLFNGIVYDLNNIPTFNKGDRFEVYGRTEGGAKITVIVRSSDTQTFTATADAQGFWEVEIDTTSLKGGQHSYQTKIESNGKEFIAQAVKFNVTEKITVSQTPTGNNDIPVPLIVAVGLGFLVVVLIIAALALRKKDDTPFGQKTSIVETTNPVT